MRLPHIYRFYLSLTSPRRVGEEFVYSRARGIPGTGGRGWREKQEEILGMPGGKKENIGENERWLGSEKLSSVNYRWGHVWICLMMYRYSES